MVDPIYLTNYNRTDNELEEVLIWGLLVAGKNGLVTAKLLDSFLKDYSHIGDSPFEIFSRFQLDNIPRLSVALKDYGFGCYNNKARWLYELVRSGVNLRTCTIDDLEKFNGIGMKTSRLFVLHTRKDVVCIPLDVHMLHYLKDSGYNVPKSTPGNKKNKKKYLTIEKLCIQLARRDGMSCADWDLAIWNRYRSRNIKVEKNAGGTKSYWAQFPGKAI